MSKFQELSDIFAVIYKMVLEEHLKPIYNEYIGDKATEQSRFYFEKEVKTVFKNNLPNDYKILLDYSIYRLTDVTVVIDQSSNSFVISPNFIEETSIDSIVVDIKI